MNKTFLFALAFGTAMASVACGDDTGTGGSADTSGSTTGTASKSTTGTNTGSNASSGSTKASSSTGMAGPPCVAACANDTGCDDMPPAPTGACATCLADEAAKGTMSGCTVMAAFDPKCQGNVDCKAMVDCATAGGMTQEMCAMANPTGYNLLRLQVLESCAECGTGIP